MRRIYNVQIIHGYNVFIGTIMILLALCSGEITCADICNSRNARRGFTTGAGYGFT